MALPVGWDECTLGDFINFSVGGVALRTAEYSDAGTPVLTKGDIKPMGRVEHGGKFVETTHAKLKGYRFTEPGDLLVTTRDLTTAADFLGLVAIAPTDQQYLVNQGSTVFRIDTNRIDPKFLVYWCSGHEYRSFIKGNHSGATQIHMRQKDLFRAPVWLPPQRTQSMIVTTLSAYDDLIDNNQRRIWTLESLVHALFQEWFVNFRFPAYEGHPRVASPLGEIPIGWEVKEMQTIAEVIDCLHSKKPKECPDGPGILLQLNNIGDGGKLDMSEIFRISTEDYRLWTSRIELRPGDCLVTNVGRVGAVAQVPEGVIAAPGRNMTAIRPLPGKLTQTFLIEYLLSSHMESETAKKKDLGTIMDSLNVKGIIRLHVPCPPPEAMDQFEKIARPIRRRIELLVEQINNLRRTRDLLLPRLLSGQINVGVT